MGSLSKEVRRFHQWQEAGAPNLLGLGHGAEWESHYPRWEFLYRAVLQCLETATELSESEKNELLYVLARDNEDEKVAGMLARAPAIVEQLIPAVFDYPDPDARWQFAMILPDALGGDAAEHLARLSQDDDEYVRRRAQAAAEEM